MFPFFLNINNNNNNLCECVFFLLVLSASSVPFQLSNYVEWRGERAREREWERTVVFFTSTFSIFDQRELCKSRAYDSVDCPFPLPIMAFVSMKLMLNLDAWMDRLLFGVTPHSPTRWTRTMHPLFYSRHAVFGVRTMTIVIATKTSDFSVNGGYLLPHLDQQNRLDWNNWTSMSNEWIAFRLCCHVVPFESTKRRIKMKNLLV